MLLTKEFSGEQSSPLRRQYRIRASPLKPTKGSAFGIRKPLKRLDLNFAVSRRSQDAELLDKFRSE